METSPFWQVPGIHGGRPVFKHTRVPVYILIDVIEHDYTILDFLRDYDTVSTSQVENFLRLPVAEGLI